MNQSKTPRARLLRDADALWQQAVCMAGKCLLCGRTKPLCGHHIKGKKARPDLRHVIANGVCVCWGLPGTCHDKVHAMGQERSEHMIRAMLPEQMRMMEAIKYEPRVVMLGDLMQTIARLRRVVEWK